MSADYVRNVHRYGAARLADKSGKAINISHADDIDPAEVQTDGRGNVLASPLIYGKDCVGRPERFARGHRGGQWWDENGVRHLNDTPCTRCEQLSPGVYQARRKVVDERVRSNSGINDTFESWDDACGDDFGRRCFLGEKGARWRAFLQAIIDHGGWTTINDEQVKIEAIRINAEKRKKRNSAATARRAREKDERRGTPTLVTVAYLQQLQAERDRRAASFKRVRPVSGRTLQAMLWLKNLPDESCDRAADVWYNRELRQRGRQKVTARAIADRMIADGRSYGLGRASLIARIYEDFARIDKLEAGQSGSSIWEPWVFSL